MRKTAAILALLVCAALLHTGAMLGFEAYARLAAAHPAAHEHGAPSMPFCPVGSICPSIQTPSLALAKLVLLFAYAVVVALVVCPPRVALAFRHAPFSPYAPPNHPKLLLSVLKRE